MPNKVEDFKEEQQSESEFLKPIAPPAKKEILGKTDDSENNVHIQRQELEIPYSEPIWARVPTSSNHEYYIEVGLD
jgi:hypothetical protein